MHRQEELLKTFCRGQNARKFLVLYQCVDCRYGMAEIRVDLKGTGAA